MTTRDDRRIRVATVNCLHGLDIRSGPPRPADEHSLEALARDLEHLDADVIALQEVDRRLHRSAGLDQTSWLGQRLSMHHVFAPTLLGDPDRAWWRAPAGGLSARGLGDGIGAYGVGILSRARIMRSRRLRLPGGRSSSRSHGLSAEEGPEAAPAGRHPGRPGWDWEPRVALRADVAWGDGVIAVTTTHLSYLPWRSLRQLGACAHLAAHGMPTPGRRSLSPSPAAALLLGDLNLPPWAVRARLPRWRHCGGRATYPAHDPRLQLDHVLTSGPFAIEDVHAAPAGTSDHRPLVVSFRLPPEWERGGPAA